MIRPSKIFLLLSLGLVPYAWSAEDVVLDFEKAVPLLADHKANRVQRWEEKGVVFTLAREPEQTKGKGMLMFFTHLTTRAQRHRLCHGYGTDSGPCHISAAGIFRDYLVLGIDGNARATRSLRCRK